jgi:hypothetical protein
MSKDRYEEFINLNFQALKDDFISEHEDLFNDWLMIQYTDYEASYNDRVYDMMRDDEFLRDYEDTAK